MSLPIRVSQYHRIIVNNLQVNQRSFPIALHACKCMIGEDKNTVMSKENSDICDTISDRW